MTYMSSQIYFIFWRLLFCLLTFAFTLDRCLIQVVMFSLSPSISEALLKRNIVIYIVWCAQNKLLYTFKDISPGLVFSSRTALYVFPCLWMLYVQLCQPSQLPAAKKPPLQTWAHYVPCLVVSSSWCVKTRMPLSLSVQLHSHIHKHKHYLPV